MLPSYEVLNSKSQPIFKIPFHKFAVYTVLLPLISFIFCVICSVLFYFQRSTATHCDVPNYLPSISAAIGNYQPQRIVWQLAIAIHFLPRLTVSKMYIEYYQETVRLSRLPLAYLACLLNIVENFALLGLSIWTSSEYYEIHKFCFVLFIAMSEIYMVLSYMVNKYGKQRSSNTKEEDMSLKYKKNLFITNISAFALAGYFFVRHNSYCEPGVYTIFAAFEYIVVLTNMGYHMTAYLDFYGRSLAFDWNRGIYFSYI